MGHTEREADIYWTNSHTNNWEGLPQSHIPIFQHTMRKQEDIRGKTHWVEKPNIPWEKKKLSSSAILWRKQAYSYHPLCIRYKAANS